MTQKLAHAVRNRFGNKMSPFDLNCHLNQRCYVSKMPRVQDIVSLSCAFLFLGEEGIILFHFNFDIQF